MVPPGTLHLLQEALSEVAPVGQLGQLVGESVLFLGLEKLSVADRHGGLGRHAEEQGVLVVGELAGALQVELESTHQLGGAQDRDHQDM